MATSTKDYDTSIYKTGYDLLTPEASEMQKQSMEYGKTDVKLEETKDGYCKMIKHVESQLLGSFKHYPCPNAQQLGLKKTVEKVTYKEGDEEFTVEMTVYQPAKKSGQPPLGMIYIHGGGMAMLDGRKQMEWTPAFHAMEGCISATIHFTNSTEAPFPRGRNDCVAAIQWFCKKYSVKGLCLYGESGGANLCLSSALQLKEVGQENLIDVLYLSCPYIHPGNGCASEAIPEDIKRSEDEFGHSGNPDHWSHFFSRALFNLYTPGEEDWKNKFAYPYCCEVEDLKGLPATWVVSNECDTLKDQGKQLWKKLVLAEVSAYHSELSGTFHYSQGHDQLFNAFFQGTMRSALKAVLAAKAHTQAES